MAPGFGKTLPLFVSLLLTPSAASAQVASALSGTVTDESGAAVPGATVDVRNLGTGLRRVVRLSVGAETVLNLGLSVRAMEEQVQVDAHVSLVETTTASTGTLITTE